MASYKPPLSPTFKPLVLAGEVASDGVKVLPSPVMVSASAAKKQAVPAIPPQSSAAPIPPIQAPPTPPNRLLRTDGEKPIPLRFGDGSVRHGWVLIPGTRESGGMPYYYDEETGVSCWEKPSGEDLGAVGDSVSVVIRRAISASGSTGDGDDRPLPKGWVLVPASPASMNRVYYYHANLGRSLWVRPTIGSEASYRELGEDSPLPDGWVVVKGVAAAGGRDYYHNKALGKSMWTRPGGPRLQNAHSVRSDVSLPDQNPLPDGWAFMPGTTRSKGRGFYYHQARNESRWTRPIGNQEEGHTGVVRDDSLPEGWVRVPGSKRSSGRPYFYNSVLNKSSWTRPEVKDVISTMERMTIGDEEVVNTAMSKAKSVNPLYHPVTGQPISSAIRSTELAVTPEQSRVISAVEESRDRDLWQRDAGGSGDLIMPPAVDLKVSHEVPNVSREEGRTEAWTSSPTGSSVYAVKETSANPALLTPLPADFMNGAVLVAGTKQDDYLGKSDAISYGSVMFRDRSMSPPAGSSNRGLDSAGAASPKDNSVDRAKLATMPNKVRLGREGAALSSVRGELAVFSNGMSLDEMSPMVDSATRPQLPSQEDPAVHAAECAGRLEELASLKGQAISQDMSDWTPHSGAVSKDELPYSKTSPNGDAAVARVSPPKHRRTPYKDLVAPSRVSDYSRVLTVAEPESGLPRNPAAESLVYMNGPGTSTRNSYQNLRALERKTSALYGPALSNGDSHYSSRSASDSAMFHTANGGSSVILGAKMASMPMCESSDDLRKGMMASDDLGVSGSTHVETGGSDDRTKALSSPPVGDVDMKKKVGSKSPLPPGWVTMVAFDQGRRYYYNAEKNLSVWERPDASTGDKALSPLPDISRDVAEENKKGGWLGSTTFGIADGLGVDSQAGGDDPAALPLILAKQHIPGCPEAADAEGPSPDVGELPAGWVALWAPNKRVYFYNQERGVTDWERPV